MLEEVERLRERRVEVNMKNQVMMNRAVPVPKVIGKRSDDALLKV